MSQISGEFRRYLSLRRTIYALNENTGLAIFHIRFFIVDLPDVSEPRAVATGSSAPVRSNENLKMENNIRKIPWSHDAQSPLAVTRVFPFSVPPIAPSLRYAFAGRWVRYSSRRIQLLRSMNTSLAGALRSCIRCVDCAAV